MDRTDLIVLQNEDAWPFRIVRIIFHSYGLVQAVDDVMHKQVVGGEFFVAVERYTDLAARHEPLYLFEGLAQFLDPFLFLIAFAAVLLPLIWNDLVKSARWPRRSTFGTQRRRLQAKLASAA